MKLQIPKLFKKVMKNIDQIVFCLAIILLIILVVRLTTKNDKEHFTSGINIYGNRSISVDSSNVTDHTGSSVDNVKLTEDSNNSGFDGANNSGDGAFLLIDLGKPKKIEAIQTRGIHEFIVNYSNENELNSFENHIIKNVSASSTSNVFKYSEILPNDETSLGTKNWDNLKNEKNRKPVARYIKITPKSANYKFQMELFTTEADSVSQSSLNIDQIEHDFILYNETDVSDAKIYNLNSSYFKIVFSKNVLVNKLVLYSKPTSKHWITNYNIKYRNSQNNYEKIITNVVGVTGANEQNHFWFPYLILADEITIEPKKYNGDSILTSELNGTGQISVYGKEPNRQEEEIALRAQERIILADLSRRTDAQPSIYELVEQNTAANQLCQSLKSQEKLNNNKIKLETNKLYLEKLQDQTTKIRELEETIKQLERVRSSKQQVEDKRKIAQLEYQNGIEAKLTDLVKERLDNQKKLKLNVNISEPRTSS